jgi:hypothetical protein
MNVIPALLGRRYRGVPTVHQLRVAVVADFSEVT